MVALKIREVYGMFGLYANHIQSHVGVTSIPQKCVSVGLLFCLVLQVYIHEWSPGDFVVWDNRSTLHSATEVIDAPQLMYQTFLRTKTPMKAVNS